MNYPFADTPANRDLAERLDRCIDKDNTTYRRIGRYSFFVYPYRQLSYNKDSFGIRTSKAHVGVIDHQTGRAGLRLFDNSHPYSYLDLETQQPGHDESRSLHDDDEAFSADKVNIEQLIHDVREGDIDKIWSEAPALFNLNPSNSYMDIYLHVKHYGIDLSEDHYQWIKQHRDEAVNEVTPPDRIGAILEGAPDARSNKMAFGFTDMGKIDHFIGRFLPSMLLDIAPYSQDKDLLDIGKQKIMWRDALPEVLLDVPEDNYSSAKLALNTSIHKRQEKRIKEFSDLFVSVYRDAIKEMHLGTDTSMESGDIERNIDKTFSLFESGANHLANMLQTTPEGLRNKLQFIEVCDNDIAVFMRLLRRDNIQQDIEAGKPLKGVFKDLPLVNLSKRSLNNFMHNCNVLFGLSPSPGEDMIQMEKGSVALSRDYSRNTHSDTYLKAIALLTTLPEAPFSKGDQRSMDGMWEALFKAPYLIDTLSSKIVAERDEGLSLKNTLSWVKPFIEKNEENGFENIHDAGRILNETFFQPIVFHLAHQAAGDPFHTVSAPIVGDEYFMSKFAKTGEYRNFLHATEQGHKLLHDAYNRGKPDGTIEWEPTTESFRHGHVTIEPITSNDELTLEGKTLRHCVGTYLRDVLNNNSYIYSVKIDGKHVSTIELSGDNLDELKIVQHRGFRNADPSPEELEAAEAFMEAIDGEEIEFEFEPCNDEVRSLPDLETLVEKQEVEEGIRFRDRDLIYTLIDDFKKVAPSLDVWECLKEHVPHLSCHIEALQSDYEKYLEKGVPSLA